MSAARIPLAIILLIVFSSSAPAAQKTFIRDYTYEASELDDRVSCQYIALEQVKRLLLEELGTYVESISTVKDYRLDHDQITTLTAGIVRTKILQESWNGTTYWMKARLSADSDEIAEAIAQLKDNRQIVGDLQEARQEAYDAMVEVERLKAALGKADAGPEQKSRYDESIRRLQATDFLERGQSHLVAGEYEEAVEAYNQVVALRPGDAKGYGSLATAYIFLGNYRGAVTNLNRAVRLSPHNHHLVMNRDIAAKMLKSPHRLTPQERNFLPRPQTVRVQHAYRPPAQAAALPYRLASHGKPETQRLISQPHQRGPGSHRPAAQLAHRHQEAHGQHARINNKPPSTVRPDHRPGHHHQKEDHRQQARAGGKPPAPAQQAKAVLPQAARKGNL